MLYLYDTTLRDGAQGQSVTFSLQDKEQVIQRLDEVGMHFIEAGNPASNPKDAELYERMRTQPLKNAKLVAFGSTRRVGAEAHADAGLNVLANVGCQHVAIFGKSWDFHVREVLHTTLQENLNMIADSVRFLCQAGKTVFFDAEHFFDGYAANPRYAMETLQAASDAGAQFLVLCDTNGGTLPEDIRNTVRAAAERFPGKIGIHCHNDSGVATAGSLTAVRMGSSSCFMSASTTLRTTSRAVSLVFSGMMPRSDMSVDTRFTSGCTLSSISGWSSILCRLRRSKASFCMTCTTEDGKKRRMSPSQRATRGDEAPLPPRRLCLLSASYSAASASSICRSSGLSPARPQLA